MFINTNNTNIWNKEEIIAYCCKQFHANDYVTLELNLDGPCLKSNGLYTLLDKLCDNFNFEKSKIIIQTANLVEKHNEYTIKIVPTTAYHYAFLKYPQVVIQKDFNKPVKHFLHFVGHGNPARLRIASYLFTQFKEKTLQTYHVDIKDIEYSRPHISIEDVMTFHDVDRTEVLNVTNFLLECPIKLDPVTLPVLHPRGLELMKFYKSGFLDIVNCSFYAGNTFCIDEKILRPIFTKTPFIVQGPANFLTRLKKIGFKTFSNYWDEGYGEDPADYQIKEIFLLIDKISKYNNAELKAMYYDMMPILEHNYNLALDLDKEKIKKVTVD